MSIAISRDHAGRQLGAGAGRRGRRRRARRRAPPRPAQGKATDAAKAIAKSLLGGERKAILLGNAAAHHANASSLLALANWIGEQTGATVGYLTEAANTVGAQLAGALPGAGGLNAGQMLGGGLKAAILLNTEPEFDSAAGAKAAAGAGTGRNGRDPEPVQGQPGIQRRAAADRAVHRNARHFRQCRGPGAELPCRGQAAGRSASGLEGAARAGQPAGPAGLRVRVGAGSPGGRARRAGRAGQPRAGRQAEQCDVGRHRPVGAGRQAGRPLRSTSSTASCAARRRCS